MIVAESFSALFHFAAMNETPFPSCNVEGLRQHQLKARLVTSTDTRIKK
jgi:hypothetical protein